MTALTDFADYKTGQSSPTYTVQGWKSALSTSGNPTNAGGLVSSWVFAGSPTSGVAANSAPNNTTTGAIPLYLGSGEGWLTSVTAHIAGQVTPQSYTGWAVLCDRLSQTAGGLSGIVTTPQSTNLPTTALTRSTSGAGVLAALEYYANVGTTAATATLSYTNQAGLGGQTSPAFSAYRRFGGGMVGSLHPMPLAPGDTGVKSVESVTLNTSTLTAGDFGVTLYRPLLAIPIDATAPTLSVGIDLAGNIPVVSATACLFWVYMQYNNSQSAAGGNSLFFDLRFSER